MNQRGLKWNTTASRWWEVSHFFILAIAPVGKMFGNSSPHTPKYWDERTSALQDSDKKQKTYLRINFIYPHLVYELH